MCGSTEMPWTDTGMIVEPRQHASRSSRLLKIARVVATPVEVPRLARLLPKTAHGEVRESRYVVLEIETGSGIVGIGEVTCSPAWNGEEALQTSRLVAGSLGSALVGADPLSWADVSDRVDGTVRNRPFLRAAVEMACLDIAGRYLGVPAHVLLGGAYRTRIATKIVLPARDIETVRRMAGHLIGRGITTVKVKVGLDVDEDVARVAAVRNVMGQDVDITVDANEGWTPAEARSAVEQLAPAGSGCGRTTATPRSRGSVRRAEPHDPDGHDG